MEQSIEMANLILAIVSIVLAFVAVALSLVFYFRSSMLNRETHSFLETLKAMTSNVHELQKDMILPAWQQFTGTISRPDPDEVKQELTEQIDLKLDSIVKEVRSRYEADFKGLSDQQQRKIDEMINAMRERTAESAADNRVLQNKLSMLEDAETVVDIWEMVFNGKSVKWPSLSGFMTRQYPKRLGTDFAKAVFFLMDLGCVDNTQGIRTLSGDSILSFKPDYRKRLSVERARLAGERDATLG